MGHATQATGANPFGLAVEHATLADLQSAVNAASPGDWVEVHEDFVGTGTLRLPAKSNPDEKWIYIVSRAIAALPPSGARVSPSDAPVR